MGVEGRSWDSAVFTAISHTWSLINRRGVNAAILTSTAVAAFYNLKLATGWLSCTFLASAVFVWLLLPCFAFEPLTAKLVPSHAYRHQRSKGLRHPLHPGNFGQSPDNRCHHMPKRAVSQLHMVTLLEDSLFFHFSLNEPFSGLPSPWPCRPA